MPKPDSIHAAHQAVVKQLVDHSMETAAQWTSLIQALSEAQIELLSLQSKAVAEMASGEHISAALLRKWMESVEFIGTSLKEAVETFALKPGPKVRPAKVVPAKKARKTSRRS
jgi:hypothetical protein